MFINAGEAKCGCPSPYSFPWNRRTRPSEKPINAKGIAKMVCENLTSDRYFFMLFKDDDLGIILMKPVTHQFPQYNAGSSGNVERMFHAELRDLYAAIALPDGSQFHAGYFIAKNHGDLFGVADGQLFERNAVRALFNSIYGIPVSFQVCNGLHGIGKMAKADGIFGAKRGFADLLVRRYGAVACEVNSFEQEGIGGAEYAAYIVSAADVFQYGDDGCFFGTPELFHRFAAEFLHA